MSTTATLRENTESGNGSTPRSWLSPLNLHWICIGVLLVVCLYLLAQMLVVWHGAGSHSADAIAEQRIERTAVDAAAEPLRGLDAKLAKSTGEADRFYRERLPAVQSQVLGEIGDLARRSNVRMTRVTYSPALVLAGTSSQLTEEKMDASLSGDYRPLMQFINSLERDKMFFVIEGVTLNGQQSGTVNLRLRLTTYLRGVSAEAATAPGAESPAAAPPAGGVR
jgi:hypothetical protein